MLLYLAKHDNEAGLALIYHTPEVDARACARPAAVEVAVTFPPKDLEDPAIQYATMLDSQSNSPKDRIINKNFAHEDQKKVRCLTRVSMITSVNKKHRVYNLVQTLFLLRPPSGVKQKYSSPTQSAMQIFTLIYCNLHFCMYFTLLLANFLKSFLYFFLPHFQSIMDP
jgi:hypothetical protein